MTTYRFCGVKPRVALDAFIAPGAQVIGDVELHERTSIWSNAVLRGDQEPIRIGAGSNVQENSVLHTDPGFPLTLGRDVTVGHNVVLHGCSVGDGSVIGINAVVLNGVVIGRACLVAAGSVVGSGQSFPDGSLISGNPAKAVMELSSADRAGLIEGARAYAEQGAACLVPGVFGPCLPDMLESANGA